MSQSRKARGGGFEWHPDECGCRKCRRMRAAVARRSTTPKDALGREMGQR